MRRHLSWPVHRDVEQIVRELFFRRGHRLSRGTKTRTALVRPPSSTQNQCTRRTSSRPCPSRSVGQSLPALQVCRDWTPLLLLNEIQASKIPIYRSTAGTIATCGGEAILFNNLTMPKRLAIGPVDTPRAIIWISARGTCGWGILAEGKSIRNLKEDPVLIS